jgi:hypothetical protein
MKANLLFLLLVVLISLLSCNESSGHRLDGTTKRVVRPAWGANVNIKVIRNVDTMFSVGDTIRLDMTGISSINEAVILK